MKIGLFFGSFNPIHTGHLIIANIMAENTDLDKVWFVVSPQNPFKKSNSLAHEFDRYKMVELAIDDHYKLSVSDVEFQMPKPSYTIDTLTYLSEKNPKHKFVLILGEDNLTHFDKWKNHQLILSNYQLYIYKRPNSIKGEIQNHPNITYIEAPLIDISATYIREQIKSKKSIKYLVLPEVEKFIHTQKIYI